MGNTGLWIPKPFDAEDAGKGFEEDGLRIIFLDVDGVLNCETTKESYGRYIGVEGKKISILKKIIDGSCEEVETKIVLSSTWRVGVNRDGTIVPMMYQYLQDRLKDYGLAIYNRTPYIKLKPYAHGDNRGEEIAVWLISHLELHITGYLVLDDCVFPDYERYGIMPHLLKTAGNGTEGGGGLQEYHIKQALEILSKPIASDR